MLERKSIRYSEAFKLQVVKELESGTVDSIHATRERYGIAGGATVQRWLRKYGKSHLLVKVVRVATSEERDRLKALKAENEAIKRAVADLHMKSVLYESWLEVACEEFGVTDLEAFRKRLAARLSDAAWSMRPCWFRWGPCTGRVGLIRVSLPA